MPFVRQKDIDKKKRSPYLNRYRKQLREALMSPLIDETQRKSLKEKLDNVGKRKVYRSDAPTPPGAIDLSKLD